MNLFKAFFVLGLVISLSVQADEGMWVFNHLPKQALKERYGFKPTDSWVENVMKASVRFNSGGSGSIISPTGLVLTNHHVAADTLEKISSADHDYYKTGFYADSLEKEIPAPDLELNVLQSIEDVTARVQKAVKPEMTPEEAAAARNAEIAQIEKESLETTGLRSDVVTLYKGGQYNLYRYKKYVDVRLVFAPEFAIAFFGGDPDNFEYPRFDLDMAIFRIYENGKPVNTQHFLPFSEKGATENELVFVSGHPGRTSRMLTMDTFYQLRDVFLPYRLATLRRREINLQQFAMRSSENERVSHGELFGIQNSRKAFIGRLKGLQDPQAMGLKLQTELELKAQTKTNPDLKKYSQVWDQVNKAQKTYRSIYREYGFLESGWAFDSRLFSIARTLVRLATENEKKNSERLPEYRDSNRASLERSLFSKAPIYESLEVAKLSDSLSFVSEEFGANHTVVQRILANRSPQNRAFDLIRGTMLADVQERKRLASGGKAAIEASTDPMIVLARSVDEEARKYRAIYDSQVSEVEQQAYAQLASLQFAVFGTNVYPDATFTLRLSFGTVKGYREGSNWVHPLTTLGGAFELENKREAKEPWKLPSTWHTAKETLNLDTPFNFVSTADIIGGNSGSPVINRQGELVGLIFDGNIQSLVGEYYYDDTQNRAVSVHSAGMLEALRKIYGTSKLVEELTSGNNLLMPLPLTMK